MHRILLTCLCFLLLNSCKQTHHINDTLRQIEEAIDHEVERASGLILGIEIDDLDSYNQGYCNLLLAEILLKKNERLLAVDSLLTTSLGCFDGGQDNELLARVLLNKGRTWHALNDSEEALGYLYPVLDVLEKHPNYLILAKTYDELGKIYMEQAIYDEALVMFNKGYFCDSIVNRKNYMVYSLCNMGKIYLHKEEPDKSLECFEVAYGRLDEKDSLLISYVYECLSIYYTATNNARKALEYTQRSIAYNQGDDVPYNKLLNLGDIYASMEQYDSAKYYLNQSALSDNLYTRTSAYGLLYEVEKEALNPETAIDYLLEYQAGFDSIVLISNKTETETLAYKYNVEKAVLEVKSRNKVYMLYLVIAFSVTLLTSLLVYLWREKKQQAIKQERERQILLNRKELLEKEREISALIHRVKLLQEDSHRNEEIKEGLTYYTELIGKKKEELFFMMKKGFESECEGFRKKHIFAQIIELSTQGRDKKNRILTYEEQLLLWKELNKTFPLFIKDLRNTFPSLTDDDIKLCCLVVTGLSSHAISLCFTVSGTNAIKQRRHRLKTKMTEDPLNSFMYEFIFSYNFG